MCMCQHTLHTVSSNICTYVICISKKKHHPYISYTLHTSVCMTVCVCMSVCVHECVHVNTHHIHSPAIHVYMSYKFSNTIIVHTSHIPLTHTTHICVYDCMSVSVYVHAYVCVSEYTCTWMCICEHHLHILQKSRMYYICVCNLFRYVIHVAFICWKQTYICHIHPHKKNILQKSRM